MTNKEAKHLVKEFETAHHKHSLSVGGYWGKGKMHVKNMALLKGYWYWRGYRVNDLIINPKKVDLINL